MPEDRRHIAVMFTDIVGYTKLMGEDEDKAFETLKQNHSIHASSIKKYNGKLIKEVGDGTLASFPLASDAVRCALEIQKEAKSQNISLKIGIHQGEMMMVGADVLGDGVNVASRLQESAEEGCISISGAVYRDVKNKAGITAEFIEDKTFKNVDEPVKVYKVHCDIENGIQDGLTQKSSNKRSYYIIGGIVGLFVVIVLIWFYYPRHQVEVQEVRVDKSIAVLPFRNDSPDQSNEYFCNGMVEAILTNLQKIEDMRVKSRTSAEQYRNPDKDLKVIASELQVAFILEGSVQKVGDNIRVTAQLIDGITGNHLWADFYDGKYTDQIFEFQGDVAKRVASSLKSVITPDEEEQIDKKPIDNIEAYDLWMRGHEMIRKWRYTRDSTNLKIALNMFNQILEVDPEFIEALRYKAMAFLESGYYDSAMYYNQKIIKLYPDSNYGYQGIGHIFWLSNQLDSAYKYFSKAYQIAPNDPWVNLILGQFHFMSKNDIIKALPYYHKAYEIEGESWAEISWNIGWIYWSIGHYEQAEKYFLQALKSRQECQLIERVHLLSVFQGKYDKAIHFLDSICVITICDNYCNEQRIINYIMRKDIDQANFYYKQLIEEGGIPTVPDSIYLAYLYKVQSRDQEANSILYNVQKSLERHLSYFINPTIPFGLSMIHAILNEDEESLKYLHDLVDSRKWLSCIDFALKCPIFENLWDNPEFKTLVNQAQDEMATLKVQVQEMEEQGELSF